MSNQLAVLSNSGGRRLFGVDFTASMDAGQSSGVCRKRIRRLRRGLVGPTQGRCLQLVAILLLTLTVADATLGKGPKGNGKGGGGRRGGASVVVGPPGIGYGGYRGLGFSIQLGPYSYRDGVPGYGYPVDRYYYSPYRSGPPALERSRAAFYAPGAAPLENSIGELDSFSAATDAVADGATPFPEGDPAQPASTVVPTSDRAATYQSRAESAFLAQRYDEALRWVNHAILEDVDNGLLRLFESQTYFAVGEYRAAVQSLEQAVDLIPVEDRGFVVRNFDRFYRGQAYVQQMDRLQDYRRQRPTDPAASLLRAYHFYYLGYEAAARDLINELPRTPRADEVGSRLAALLNGELQTPQELPAPPPEPVAPER